MKYQLIYLSNLNKIIININLYYGHVFTIKKNRDYTKTKREEDKNVLFCSHQNDLQVQQMTSAKFRRLCWPSVNYGICVGQNLPSMFHICLLVCHLLSKN